MSKGRNKQASSRRYTLPKSKILRGRTHFGQLFSNEATVIYSRLVSLRFRVYNERADCKMAFIVPKKRGKAVQRNRVKRLLKEAYRLNQYMLFDEVSTAAITFHGALIAKTVDVEYEEVESNVIELLYEAQNHIQNY